MPIPRRLADIQARQVEVGRIRLGTTETAQGRSGDYQKPVKLESFRLTSRSKTLIEEAASLYGGSCEPWTPQSGGAQQWQVFTEQRSLAVIVPPDPVSQYYEMWQGGRCQRRCDGLTELLSDQSCICGPDPEVRKCKPTTRLALMLADMSGIGVWRLETHGYHAAAELPAVADLLSAVGGNVPARLEMEERSAMVPDPRDRSKEVPTRFMVPVLHVQRTPAQMVAIMGGNGQPAIALPGTPDRPALPPAPINGPSYDPDQEQERVTTEVRVNFEREIASAGTVNRLNEIANAIRGSGLTNETMNQLRAQWQARLGAIQAAPREGPEAFGQSSTHHEPVRASEPEVDKQAEWMAIQSTAAQLGLGFSGLVTRYQEFSATQPTGPQTVQQASGADLARFHQALQQEVASR